MDGSCLSEERYGAVIESIGPHDMRNYNEIGLFPVEYKVLIKPDEVDEMTSGGLHVPDTVRQKEFVAQVRGTILAIGGRAFEDFNNPSPKVGDKVFFAKYAGVVVKKDRQEYRIVNDKDICAIIADEELQGNKEID